MEDDTISEHGSDDETDYDPSDGVVLTTPTRNKKIKSPSSGKKRKCKKWRRSKQCSSEINRKNGKRSAVFETKNQERKDEIIQELDTLGNPYDDINLEVKKRMALYHYFKYLLCSETPCYGEKTTHVKLRPGLLMQLQHQ